MSDSVHREYDLGLLSSLDCQSLFDDSLDPSTDDDVILPSPFEMNNVESLYWDTDKLSQKFIDNNCIAFVHQNIQGLPYKFDNFVTFLNNLSGLEFGSRPIVLALSETWLTDYNASSFEIPGYHPLISHHRKDNSGRGGVGLYIRNDFEYAELPELSTFVPYVFESLFVTLKSINTTLGVIYRTPDSNSDEFMPLYEKTITALQNKKAHFFLLGDFNFDLLKFNKDPASTNFVNSTFEKGCIPVITKPTRIGPSSASCIDNIITNKVNQKFCSGFIVEDVSDHFPVFYSFRSNEPVTNKLKTPHEYKLKRNFSKVNLEKLKSLLSNYNWTDLTKIDDPESAANVLNETIANSITLTCPATKIKTKGKYSLNQPWFTSGLKISSKRKNKLFKKAHKSPRSLQIYRRYRNVYNSLIKLAKKTYYSDLLGNVKNDLRKTWRVFNEIISKSSSRNQMPTTLSLPHPTSFSCFLSEPSLIAEYFNNFFSTIGQRTASCVMSNEINPLDFMKNVSVKDSLFLFPTCPKEIIEIALNLPSKSSTGPDNISNKLLKEIISYIVVPLTHIFNLSLQTGVVPDMYKLAKVVPLFKSGDKQDPNNYRPISLLPSLSKILERIVYNRLIGFLLKHDVIYYKQFGFLKGRSTEQAMTEIILKIIEAIENKNYSLGVFLDLSKAFDSISHNILLTKLFRYGVRGIALDWFKSFLSNRHQYVQIDNAQSSTQSIEYGVPQGSVLGPLLFLIYINDMPSASSKLSLILFADDTTGLFNAPSLDELFSTVNNELNNLSLWLSANQLLINISKTNFIIFMNKQKERYLALGDHHILSLNSVDIKKKDSTKFLGLLLDKNLTYQAHLNSLKVKLTKALYALRRAAKILPVKDLKTLYSALFLSYINYGLLAWGGICKREARYHILNYGAALNPMGSLDDIHKLQKRALRIISKSNSKAHHIPLCHRLNVLDLPDLYSLKALSFCHDHFHGNLPPSLSNLFTFDFTRGNQLIVKTRYRRTNLAASSIIHTLPNIWNTLPHEIQLSIFKSKGHFLQLLKGYFISKYSDWNCNKRNCYVCT